jgi:hypothetical protein
MILSSPPTTELVATQTPPPFESSPSSCVKSTSMTVLDIQEYFEEQGINVIEFVAFCEQNAGGVSDPSQLKKVAKAFVKARSLNLTPKLKDLLNQ